MAYNYRQINFDVMSDTEHCCRTIPELISGIEYSIANQYMVAEEVNLDQPLADSITNSGESLHLSSIFVVANAPFWKLL